MSTKSLNDVEEMNNSLHRHLKDGSQYEGLIPKKYCEASFSGNGLTDFSVSEIAHMINEHYLQMDKVAQLLSSSSLDILAENIHNFAYWHFQYDADKTKQMLRSPACSWHSRKTGIDCKSFSILIGSLLKCLGYSFYIRKIKQAGYFPNEFTHVYIILPQDQKTANLEKGYYVLDGTINPSFEAYFLQANDTFMSGLPHYRLNGIATTGFGNTTKVSPSQNINLSSKSPEPLNGFLEDAAGFIGDLDLGSIFGNLSCLGGTAFDKSELDDVSGNISDHIETLIVNINNAVVSGQNIGRAVAQFKRDAKYFTESYKIKKQQQDWNKCSTDNFNAIIKFCSFFSGSAITALDAWLSQYFTKGSQSDSISITNKLEDRKKYLPIDWIGRWETTPLTLTEPIYDYSSKGFSIPAFEINQQLVDSSQSGGFNVNQWLNTLSDIIFNPPTQTDNPNHNPNQGSPISDNGINSGSNQKQAGYGWVFGGILVALGIGTAVYYSSNSKKQNHVNNN